MTKYIFIWIFLFLLFLIIQHALGEYYLIIKKGYKRAGYRVSLAMQSCSIILGCYLIVFDEYLNFLGLIFILITFYLSFKYENRRDKREKEKKEKTSQTQ